MKYEKELAHFGFLRTAHNVQHGLLIQFVPKLTCKWLILSYCTYHGNVNRQKSREYIERKEIKNYLGRQRLEYPFEYSTGNNYSCT